MNKQSEKLAKAIAYEAKKKKEREEMFLNFMGKIHFRQYY